MKVRAVEITFSALSDDFSFLSESSSSFSSGATAVLAGLASSSTSFFVTVSEVLLVLVETCALLGPEQDVKTSAPRNRFIMNFLLRLRLKNSIYAVICIQI